MTRNEQLLQSVRTAIRAEGAIITFIDITGSGHRRVNFEIAGRHGWVIIAGTPGRGRATANAVAVARRLVRATKQGARART